MTLIASPHRPLAIVLTLIFSCFATAQPQAQAPAPSAPTAIPVEPEKVEKTEKVERVEVIGKNPGTEERRNSTAAKIIITREDIEQYGDTNLGEVMRRLPGVTTGGRPGRPGAPRMRGMSGGFTQILIDGQRIPPGFNVEEITPEQVERIEILRAPTAETGARAIAGTINIILREPLRTTNNDVRLGAQSERRVVSGNASFTRNDAIGEAVTYNVTASINKTHQLTDTRTHSIYSDALTDAKQLERLSFNQSDDRRQNLFMSARMQWRLGVGEQFGLQSFVALNSADNNSRGTLDQIFGTAPPLYAARSGHFDGEFNVARLNANLNKRIDADTRYELRIGGGGFWSTTHSRERQFDGAGTQTLFQTTDGKIQDRSWSSNGKLIRNFALGGQAVTAGFETESVSRNENSLTLLNGAPQLAELGTEFAVSTNRLALYVQDEWDPAENWSANVGLRYETIQTKSSNASDSFTNVSRVLTPVAHAVWRFASPGRDQIRLSLTQSYKSPTVQQLTSRPTLNAAYPVPGANTGLTPDRAGNPNLKPELANGIDLAYESYLASGGVMSVNLFQRNIKQLVRNVTAREDVSWASVQRYVNRPQNLGDAITRGVEFDAKFQLKELMATSENVSFRLNMAVFDSKVASVPGPYNRIDQQPRATGNFGVDYRLRGVPLMIGGNFGWTPAYSTQLTESQSQVLSTKRVFDAFALWTITPATKIRFTVSNIAPINSITQTTIFDAGLKQYVLSSGRTDMSAAIRLEMRL